MDIAIKELENCIERETFSIDYNKSIIPYFTGRGRAKYKKEIEVSKQNICSFMLAIEILSKESR